MDEVYLTTTERLSDLPDRGKLLSASTERYDILGAEGEWHVAYGKERSMAYASREAAFEAAVNAASNALRDGRDVTIHVAGIPDLEGAPQ